MHRDMGFSVDEFENMYPYELVVLIGLHKERMELEEQKQQEYRKEIDATVSRIKVK